MRSPVRVGCAQCASRLNKKVFFRFCSDKLLFKGFLARRNLEKFLWGRPYPRKKTEDSIEPITVTRVGAEGRAAFLGLRLLTNENPARKELGRGSGNLFGHRGV